MPQARFFLQSCNARDLPHFSPNNSFQLLRVSQRPEDIELQRVTEHAERRNSYSPLHRVVVRTIAQYTSAEASAATTEDDFLGVSSYRQSREITTSRRSHRCDIVCAMLPSADGSIVRDRLSRRGWPFPSGFTLFHSMFNPFVGKTGIVQFQNTESFKGKFLEI